jgi:deoxyguanosine kinase
MNYIKQKLVITSRMIVTVEGNIGSGKSTLLKLCESLNLDKPHVVVYEKVGDWTTMKDTSGDSIFDLFYQDKKRYSYVFQSYVLMSRVSHMLNMIRENPGKIIICERSLLTDFEIFAKTLYDSGDFTEIEWNVYVEWHKNVRDLFNNPIQGQIYLQTSPEVCMERIKHRNRQSEHLITREYIDKLHKRHEEWLSDKDALVPTLNINGNSNYIDDEGNIHSIMESIKNFVNNIVI